MSGVNPQLRDHQPHTVYIVSPLSRLPELVRTRVPDLNVLSYPIPEDFRIDPSEYSKLAKLIDDSKADIIITFHTTLRNLVQRGLSCDHLRWFQSCSAGIDQLFRAFQKPPEHMVFTRMGEGFGELMAEYVLGQIISREHYFPQMVEYQRQKIQIYPETVSIDHDYWNSGNWCHWLYEYVAAACKAFGMTVRGLCRTKKRLPNFDVLLRNEDLSKFLTGCDYVCSILPSTAETKGMLSGDVLKACQDKRSVFINVGRGDVIDEASIVRALNNRWIGGAILDAIDREPLPADSPLWTHPDVVITPHVSGPPSTDTIARVFVSNYQKFIRGEPLEYMVDWKLGY